MDQRVLLLLTALFATGCIDRPGGRVIVFYEPGQKPKSRKVAYDATVELIARDQQAATGPLTSTGVTSGTRVGFREESDGSVVAFVGERPVPIPEGRSEWVMVSTSWPRWWSRRGEDLNRAAEASGTAIYLTGVVVGAAAFTAAYALAGGSPGSSGSAN